MKACPSSAPIREESEELLDENPCQYGTGNPSVRADRMDPDCRFCRSARDIWVWLLAGLVVLLLTLVAPRRTD